MDPERFTNKTISLECRRPGLVTQIDEIGRALLELTSWALGFVV